MIEFKMAEQIAGKNPLQVEAFRKRCSELRQQLQGDSDALHVQMAVSQVVACWCFIQIVELSAHRSGDVQKFAKSLAQAQQRYEISMRTFAQAKRLEHQLST